MKALHKNNLREIKKTLGRFVAIGAITMLGVGFFAGLSVTRQAMLDTADEYFKDAEMFDYKLMSTMGLRDGDVEALLEEESVKNAEGVFSADFIGTFDGGEFVFTSSTMTESVNVPQLISGRMPENPDECVVDSLKFTSDDIGKSIALSSQNDSDTLDKFAYDEYKIVGIVTSPLYIDRTRPTSKLGSGTVSAFVIFDRDGIDSDYYTEVYLTLDGDEYINSDEYNDKIDENTDRFEAVLENLAVGYYTEKYDEAAAEINDAAAEISDGEKELADARDELESHRAELEDAKTAYSDGVEAVNEAKITLEDNEAQLDAAFESYNEGLSQYNAMVSAGYPVPAGTKEQLDLTYAALTESRNELEAAKAEIAEKEAELEKAAEEIRSGEEEILSAEEEIAEHEQELIDAKAELDATRDELNEFEKPDTYLLSRSTNIGYANFDNNASIVQGIARVLPIFFFAVAALVCSTTMARMVSDSRTEIGTLKALGYSDRQIMLKYVGYSGLSAAAGCLLGFFLGSWLFPTAIWVAYKMLYLFADKLKLVLSLKYFIISAAAAMLCSVGVTYVTVKNEMRECPASLIRPRAPTSGKRILLERIGFIWNRFKFIHKVSIRNIFRYKKRLIMMILGIGGCTALIVTGFGINDSISDIVSLQYDEILKYDLSLTISEAADEEYKREFRETNDDLLEYSAFIGVTSAELETDGGIKSVSLISTEDSIENLIDLHTTDGEKIEYPAGNNAVICSKLASLCGCKIGDEIEIKIDETETLSVVISGIFENYVSYMIYLSPEAFTKSGLSEPEEKVIYAVIKDGLDIHETAAELMSADGAVSATITIDFKNMVDDMMTSMGAIVFLVILCAAALAFIVLYNLTNINITERVREIATLKVLGFYPAEVSNYIFRENIVLTLIGIIFGLPGGVLLHRFVMAQVNIDLVSFKVQILPLSFVFAAALTMIFTVLINLFMQIKLSKINMAESLKSVE